MKNYPLIDYSELVGVEFFDLNICRLFLRSSLNAQHLWHVLVGYSHALKSQLHSFITQLLCIKDLTSRNLQMNLVIIGFISKIKRSIFLEVWYKTRYTAQWQNISSNLLPTDDLNSWMLWCTFQNDNVIHSNDMGID